MPNRDASFAMELRQINDGESGVPPHGMPQHNVSVIELCMFTGHAQHMTFRRHSLPKQESCSHNSSAQAQAGGGSLQDYPWRSQEEGRNNSPTPSRSPWAGGDSSLRDHPYKRNVRSCSTKRRHVVMAPMAWAGGDSGEQRRPTPRRDIGLDCRDEGGTHRFGPRYGRRIAACIIEKP